MCRSLRRVASWMELNCRGPATGRGCRTTGHRFHRRVESDADAGYRRLWSATLQTIPPMTRAISGRPARCLRNWLHLFGFGYLAATNSLLSDRLRCRQGAQCCGGSRAQRRATARTGGPGRATRPGDNRGAARGLIGRGTPNSPFIVGESAPAPGRKYCRAGVEGNAPVFGRAALQSDLPAGAEMPKVLREHVASPGVILVGLIEPEHQPRLWGAANWNQGTNTLIGHFRTGRGRQ